MANIYNLLEKYTKNRENCIPLVASENHSSNYVRCLLSSDLGNRYHITTSTSNGNTWDYPRQEIIHEIYKYTESLTKKIFKGNFVSLSALSGNQCVLGILLGLTKKGDFVLGLGHNHGGHWALRSIAKELGVKVLDIPFRKNSEEIDYNKLDHYIDKYKPKFLMFDASHALFLFPVQEIKSKYNNKFPIFYDISQIMGLIAGNAIRNPLLEGATCIHGSTHKSFFGPQKGLLVFNSNKNIYEQIENCFHPTLASNIHLDHIAAFAGALEENALFGELYAKEVVRNAQHLARNLSNNNIYIPYKSKNYTETHQIWIPISSKEEGYNLFKKFENYGILLNLVELPFNLKIGFRLGTAEITRIGYNDEDINSLSEIISDILQNRCSDTNILERIDKITSANRNIKYALSNC